VLLRRQGGDVLQVGLDAQQEDLRAARTRTRRDKPRQTARMRACSVLGARCAQVTRERVAQTAQQRGGAPPCCAAAAVRRCGAAQLRATAAAGAAAQARLTHALARRCSTRTLPAAALRARARSAGAGELGHPSAP
jgi:hypothetical protein